METTLQARGSTYILPPAPTTSPKYASSPGRHWFPTPAFYAPLLLVTIATLLFGLFAVPSNVSAQSNGPKPTNLTAQVVDGGVLLNWDAPAEDASSVTGYQILRRNPWNGETELIILVADTNSTDTSYTDATATESGVRYTYGVKAMRGSLKSDLSNHAFAEVQEDICPEGGNDPVAVEVTAVPMVVESTTDDYFVLYVRHESDDGVVDLPVSVTLGENGTTTLSENVASLPKERYRVEKFSVADPADVDGDCTDDITELGDPGNMNPVNPAAPIALSAGAVAIPDRETFEELSAQELSEAFYYLLDEDPSEGRISYMRFILFDMDTDRPGVYFANTAAWTRHGGFVDALGLEWDGIVRGEIAYQPHLVAPNDSQGVYSFRLSTFNFDHPFDVMDRAYTLLAASMPLLDDNLALHLRNYELPFSQDLLPLYRDSRINLVFDEHIFPDTAFQALNTGEAYGLLRSRGPDERPQSREIVIYEALPNNLPRVAGIISSAPQTPLSHVNLRAVQDGLPNAFIRDAHEDADIDSLLGSFVHYTVTEDGWTLRAATPEEVETHYAAILPSQDQTPQRDLSVTSITPLSQIDFEDWDAFGVKAANVAVLNDLSFQSPTATAPNGFAVPLYFYDHVVVLSESSSQSPPVTFPNGFAVPFYFYDEFMKANDFYDEVEQMLAVPGFHSDFDIQEAELKKLRKKIKKGTTPEWIETALTQMHATYPEGTSLRYRSSTNNEDLPGFNGAGLYDSKTQHPEETMEDGISKSLKQVYASLWNFRAFTQREFHRVDHLTTAMGVLVHPNYSDELANGVAVSFDPVYGRDGWYYINTQLGEDLVTNPDALSTPEEILVISYEFPVVLATSNLLPPGELLLSRSQQYQVRSHLEVIHGKFAELYDPEPSEPFAMEIEFKITSDNVLSIKQARPWVFGPVEAAGPTPLTASIHAAPENHDGQNSFTFELRFSEEPDPDISYRTLRDHAFGVTDGAVRRAQRLEGPSNVRWEITVLPDSEAEVVVVLPVTTDCEDEGAICTEDGRMLSAEATLAVRGPAGEEDQTPAVNTPATGGPVISGTSQVGETLAADTSGISDADGLSGATFSYQWVRNDGSAVTDIAGATGATYTLVDADEGIIIRVQVSFTDDGGGEETLSSAATAAVTAAPTPLTASIHDAPENHDGQNSFTFELRFSEEPDLSYRTLQDHSFTVTGGAVTNARRLAPPGNVRWEITVLPDSEVEVTVVLPVTADCEDEGAICTGDGRMLSVVATLAAGGPVEEEEQTPAENTPATGVPTISGTVQVGETLTADTSGIADADGLSNATYNYQWIRNDGSADTDIHGATDSTFTLTSDDEGKSIKVRVTFTDDDGNEEELTSNAVLGLTAEPTDRPHSLTATVSGDVIILTWQDTDNYRWNNYQILRHRPELGEPEPLIYVDYTQNSGLTFTDTEVEPGVLYVYRVKAVVDFFGSLGEASDAAEVRMPDSQTVLEPDPPAPAETNSPATGAPTISGTAQVGETLTADASGIEDEDGLSNAAFSYQWIRNDGSGDADIAGATGATYTLVDADEGKTVRVRVAFVDDGGNEESLTSTATATVQARPNSPATGAPTISGTARVGEMLTADTSGIADADGLSNATFSYQWERNDGSGDAEIAGATGATYTLVDADEGKTIRVRVAFVDDRGHQETRTSAATAATVPAPDSESETEEDDSIWSATMTAGLLYDGYGYSSFAGGAGELSDTAFDLDGVTYTIKTVVAWGWLYIMVDRELPTDFTFEVDGARFNLSDASLTIYSYASEYRWSEAETNWSEGDNVQLALYSVD